MSERHGTVADTEKVIKVFKGLGFKCLIRQNQTVSQMKDFFKLGLYNNIKTMVIIQVRSP